MSLDDPFPFLHLARSEQNGAATGVDSICTYRHDPMSPPLERKQLYQEVTQLTNGITRLGPYILDRDSLYVNGEYLCHNRVSFSISFHCYNKVTDTRVNEKRFLCPIVSKLSVQVNQFLYYLLTFLIMAHQMTSSTFSVCFPTSKWEIFLEMPSWTHIYPFHMILNPVQLINIIHCSLVTYRPVARWKYGRRYKMANLLFYEVQ